MNEAQPARAAATSSRKNPLLAAKWPNYGLPKFGSIEPEHFSEAFDSALDQHLAEIDIIAGRPAAPTFSNTIVAFEKSGRLLNRVCDIFFNLTSAHTNDALQAIELEIAPRLAAHHSAIMLNGALFARVDKLSSRRDKLRLADEQRRLLDLHHLWFRRAGAQLSESGKVRIAEISERLALLATQFSQNVLKDEQSWRLVLETQDDLAGLPEPSREAAARAADDVGLAGKFAITLARSSVEGFLQFSARRDLRETAFHAWARRGELSPETDNRALLSEIVALRAEMAGLLGYETYADHSLADTMAKTPSAVRDLLSLVWPKALARVAEERSALQRHIASDQRQNTIAAWDWRYLAEKERRARFDLDDRELRPYLVLDNMIEAAFFTAHRLFGLSFRELDDAPRYHPDVRVWDVTDATGTPVGLFMGDYFARGSKRSGAWMSSFRSQHKLGAGERPIIVNVMNFSQGAEGERSLLSVDDARTLFHEFGHGLHGLLSDVTYPSISGTSVARDFVELPSQLFEHWLMTPEILQRFAKHMDTGEVIPDDLVDRLKAARNFNQGFATTEYAACAFVDLELHTQPAGRTVNVSQLEIETLAGLGMPAEIVMRHRPPHFTHIVGGYAAGYYSYLWSEVLDADAFAAFEETGDVFDPETATRLRELIYSAGNRRDPHEAYRAFRGRDPDVTHLLAKRGFSS